PQGEASRRRRRSDGGLLRHGRASDITSSGRRTRAASLYSTPEPMDITERRTGDVVTLSLTGKLDTTSAKTFEAQILSRIAAGDRRFIIDLAQLDYISSSGLRVFLVAAKRLERENGKIALCALTQPVRDVFDVAGFSSIFPVHASHDEAMREF